MADHDSIFKLGRAAFDTWYPEVSEFADVYFAIGECLYPPEMKDAVLCLDTPDVYPPQVKEFKLWQHFAKYPKGKYDFFFKVDLDSYINANQLKALLAEHADLSDQAMYMGKAALGRKEERNMLGITLPFCMGYAYFMTFYAVELFAQVADQCLVSFVSAHSDTEVRLDPFCFICRVRACSSMSMEIQ
jgi:hypothetical protein